MERKGKNKFLRYFTKGGDTEIAFLKGLKSMALGKFLQFISFYSRDYSLDLKEYDTGLRWTRKGEEESSFGLEATFGRGKVNLTREECLAVASWNRNYDLMLTTHRITLKEDKLLLYKEELPEEKQRLLQAACWIACIMR